MIPAIIAIIFSLIFPVTSSGQPNYIDYYYPANNSNYVLPVSNISFTFRFKISENFRNNLELTLTGEKSGKITGRLNLLRNERTVNFSPDKFFINGDEISVKIYYKISVKDKILLKEFSFTISEKIMSGKESAGIVDAINSDMLPVSETTTGLTKLNSGPLPATFPFINITTNTNPARGKIFCSNISPLDSNIPYLMILENNGNPVFYRRMKATCTDFKEQPNGLLTYFTTGSRKFYGMDSTYTIIDSFYCGNGYQNDVHELRLLPDGNALLLAMDPQVVDMSKIFPGGKTDAVVVGAIIQEIDQDKNVVFQWRSWDHFNITDAEHIDLTASTIDYVHANALEIDYDGNILLSSRHLSEITKINRETGKIIWRLGGKNNQFTFINDSIGFSYQHAIRRTKSGTYTLFDNGNYHTPPFSRAVEYKIDDYEKTAKLIWEYRNSPLSFSPALGYVDRLDNGNTTVSWGMSDHTFSEINTLGQKVYEFKFNEGIYSYRIIRNKWKENKPVQQQRNAEGIVAYQNFPNPFNSNTIFTIDLPEKSVLSLKIYNILGEVVALVVNDKFFNAGKNIIRFDASGFSSGVYFYQFIAGGDIRTNKMIILK